MGRAKPITKEQTDKVISLRGKMTAKQIADTVGVTYYQVGEVFKRHNMTDKYNRIFDINDLQHQIYLSGKLGDGNYKHNGSNYYYRESHAEDEKQYLMWKMNALGDMINKGGLYDIKKGGYNVQQLYGFSTVTSPSLIKYAEMTILDTISNLNKYGLIMFMLDDGWFSRSNFMISGGSMNDEELNKLCCQFDRYGIHNVHIVGQKRHDISIPSDYNELLFEIATEIMPTDIDIVQKKFKYII